MGYHLGFGADVKLTDNNNGSSAIILLVKGGVNQPFGKDIYKVEEQKYDPSIKKRDWGLSLGVNFGGRISR